MILATVENWSGDFVAAREHFDRALEILMSPTGSGVRREKYGALLLSAASFRVDAGDLVGAEALLNLFGALELKFPPEHVFWLGEPLTRAQIALARGDLDSAGRELARALRSARSRAAARACYPSRWARPS